MRDSVCVGGGGGGEKNFSNKKKKGFRKKILGKN